MHMYAQNYSSMTIEVKNANVLEPLDLEKKLHCWQLCYKPCTFNVHNQSCLSPQNFLEASIFYKINLTIKKESNETIEFYFKHGSILFEKQSDFT